MGETRTLVLVNGRRLPPGDPSRKAGDTLGSAADINNIPAFLVKRVDVLTGGASAAYGADAVAGVVNFVMDTDFTGIKVDLQGGLNVHQNGNPVSQIIAADPRGFQFPTGHVNDGGTYDASIAVGHDFADGRGHFVAYGAYHYQRPVLEAARDYSSCWFSTNASTVSALDNLSCFGSRNSAAANFITNGGVGDTGAGSFIVDGTTHLPRDFANNDRYNFAPINYYQRPDKRWNAGLFAHFDVSDAFKPYVDFMYMQDRSLAQIAPSGTFGNVFTINCSNPFLTSAVAGALACPTSGPGSLDTVTASIFKRNVEGGGRVDDLQHKDFRILGGFKGDLGKTWSYDVTGQLGKTIYKEEYRNDFSFARTRLAINDCLNPDGTPVSDTSCAPYNIFTGSTTIQQNAADGVTQAAINYVNTPGHKSGYTKEIVASATLNGKLGDYGIQSPFAEDGADIAIGGEYRKETLVLNTDTGYATGDLLGQGGETKPSRGSFDVKEAFIELNLPLASEKPFLQKLNVDGAYRYSDYSSVGTTNTWKFGFTWQPFDGEAGAVRFRGSINRAVRAPTLQDLYAPRQLGLDGSFDTCAGDGADAPNFAQCQRTALNDPNFAAHYPTLAFNPASQYNAQTAGGAAAGTTLRPEVAITKTVGLVVAPTGGALRGLSASVDYYHISLRDTIKTDGYDTIFNQCYNGTDDPATDYYCTLIKRDPTNGSLWLGPGGFIIDPIYNAGRLRNSGIDVDLSYSTQPSSWGRFSFGFTGSYLIEEKTEVLQHNNDGTLTSLGFYDCKGFYGDSCGNSGSGGQPSPKWRHRLRATWESPDGGIAISGNWRYIGGTKWQGQDTNPLDPLAGSGGPFDRIKPYSYFDLAVTFEVEKRFEFRMGVNNMFDKDPPIINGNDQSSIFVNGNTFPGMYDALGRYVFFGVTARY
jgi:outer membrane receptor protein involved in Fe transport